MSAPTTGGDIAGLSPEQQLEALHKLWEDQQSIWDDVRARFTSRLRAMSSENNLLAVELRAMVAERDALLAAPSKLFEPRLNSSEGRQAERSAFAAGLHHATILPRHTTGRTLQQEAA